jgi:hypothetical protein
VICASLGAMGELTSVPGGLHGLDDVYKRLCMAEDGVLRGEASLLDPDLERILRARARFLAPGTAIDPDLSIASLGVDSLDIIELVVHLIRDLIGGVADRIYATRFPGLADFFHDFISEENKTTTFLERLGLSPMSTMVAAH